MRALDIITRKRDGAALSEAEIDFFVREYVAGAIPDYQASAWLMAVFFRGMDFRETGWLTRSMINSGAVFDLGGLRGPFVDKHSTGGVGDKTSLILAPLAAACGVRVPMMSGRGLGHTGGTLDKLDAVEGYRSLLGADEFRRVLDDCGFAMTGQTKEVVPADRLLYALRDVTGTVESIPLITASILSKKFAEGSDALVFDVKTGSGAFMKTPERSRALAESLVNTAASLGRRAVALVTDMDFPLGWATGNFFEVEESFACLDPAGGQWRAEGAGGDLSFSGPSGELMELTLELAAPMLVLGGAAADRNAAFDLCLRRLADGSAKDAFLRNLRLQGADPDTFRARCGSFRAPLRRAVAAPRAGYWNRFDAYRAGMAAVGIGVGRATMADRVLPDVGFILAAERGQQVAAGQTLLTVYAHDEAALAAASAELAAAVGIDDAPAAARRLVLETVRPR